MHPILNIAIKAARSAGDYILGTYENYSKFTIETKNPNDFVTSVDKSAENIIIQTIQKAYPDHDIFAEESGTTNNNSDTLWIIDPIDGTLNFMHGAPLFCISIAVKVKGIYEHAVIFNPLSSELFTASKGNGARVNDTRLRINPQQSLKHCLVANEFNFTKRDSASMDKLYPLYKSIYQNCHNVIALGSAALTLAHVAAGRINVSLEQHINEYDVAAGILLVREAGGIVTDFQGSNDLKFPGVLVAGPTKAHKEVLELIQ